MENATKTSLFVIDMQNDFVQKNSAVYVSGAKKTIPRIKSLVEKSRKNGWKIFFIIREHEKDGSDAENYRKKFFQQGKGFCIRGTEGFEIVRELSPQKNDTIFVKKRNSAFFGTDLHRILQQEKIENIVICGTQYPNCIRGTAADAMSFGYRTIVCTDASSAKSKFIARANIRDMKNMGIECIPLKKIDLLCLR